MGTQKTFIIILALVVILGGIWFVARDKGEVEDDNEVLVEDETIDNDENNEDVVENEETTANDNTENQDSQDNEDPDEAVSSNEDENVESTDIEVGKPAPDFTLKNLDGESVSLSDYEGKIVLLNFWATWCVYCDIEMPDLNKLNDEFDDVVVLAVDVMEDKQTVKDYIEEGGYDFDVVLDTEGEVAQTYLVSAFPTSYFIEHDGTVIGAVPGMLEYDQMVEIIDKIKENR